MCISVLILTLNEQGNLPACLDAVSWSDDVVVFDSYSRDRTQAIARSRGARVFQRRFDDYAGQRNAALTEVAYRHDWVLMVDGDERWDRTLYEEMKQAIGAASSRDICLYHFRRKDMFMGIWLKHSLSASTWTGRLVRVGQVSVRRGINEEYHTTGRKGYLNGRFVHYPFHRGIAFWLERHNRYSTMEAEALVREAATRLPLHCAVSPDPALRRKWFKQLAYGLPCRAWIVFVYLYVARGAFLDGRPGLMYCQLRMLYERMIDLKVIEIRRHP